MINRRLFTTALGCAGASSLAMLPLRGFAQPLSLAKVLCGFPPGGTADVLSRRLADRLHPGYANTVVVDNRSGAGGQIAMTVLRESPGDGTVLCVTPSSLLSVNPHTFQKLPYKPQSDAVAVSLLCDFDHALGVGPGVPASVVTVKDFIAWSRSNNAGYGTPGSAGIPHLIGVMLTKASGAPLVNIPYRGSAPALTDLMGGQVPSVIAPVGDFLPYLAGGKVRLLAVAGSARSRFVPQVPTLRESGFDVAARDWFGVFMPPKTSSELIARAAENVRNAVASPELKAAFTPIAMEPAASTPAALAQRIKEEDASWARIVNAVGFTPE